MHRPGLPRRLAAETLGTFCLVFAGTGAVVVGAVAGGSIGPGGVAAARHFPMGEVAPYVAAQILGAVPASVALRGLFGRAGGLGATHPDHVGRGGALLLEAGLTAVLMVVILAVATDTRAVGSLAALWIHLTGPTLGALAGAALYAFLRGGDVAVPIEQEARA